MKEDCSDKLRDVPPFLLAIENNTETQERALVPCVYHRCHNDYSRTHLAVENRNDREESWSLWFGLSCKRQ